MTPDASSLAARAMAGRSADQGAAAVGAPALRLLRTFLVVVGSGGFSAAAAQLQVDLSTVSRQFKELESWVGARLAERGRGGFSLTAEGRHLHTLAQQLVAAVDAFGTGAALLGRARAPLLRLGIVDALLGAQPATDAGLLTAALMACVDRHPGLQVQLRTLTPTQIEHEILAGRLDAGIIAARPAASGLQQHRLYSEPNNLYVAPGHPWHAGAGAPLDEAALAQARFVADPYGDTLPVALQAACAQAPPAARADSIEAVALLVQTGRFAGVLPDHLVRHSASLQRLRAVWPARFAHRQDIVLTCPQGQISPVLRCLIRQLVQAAAPRGDQLPG